ncbi:4122_t:CDS:2, partial [Acaulospora morrowiae]
MHPKEIAKINALLIQWIICDQQSFSIIKNKKFQALVAALSKYNKYNLPSRQMISTTIENLYEKQRNILKTYFNNLSSKVVLTTDIWTAYTNQAYMSITLYWIDDNWQMHCILFDLIPLHERYTGTNLANIIDTIISNFNLGKKIMAITTDNAYNMDAFGQKCAAHILNLIVKDGLEEAKMLTILLEPIFEATRIISASSHPTLSDLHMVLVVITDILKEAQQENNTIIKWIVDKMEKKLNKYWGELKSAFHKAIILDPNSKLASFKDEEKCEAQNMIYTTYKANYATKNNRSTTKLSKPKSQRHFIHNHLKRTHEVFTSNDDPLDKYLNMPLEDGDVLAYWKNKSTNPRWVQ